MSHFENPSPNVNPFEPVPAVITSSVSAPLTANVFLLVSIVYPFAAVYEPVSFASILTAPDNRFPLAQDERILNDDGVVPAVSFQT